MYQLFVILMFVYLKNYIENYTGLSQKLYWKLYR